MWNYTPNREEWHRAMMNHEEPVCPKCGKGRIVCPAGKIKKPHSFECTNQCGFYVNYVRYDDNADKSAFSISHSASLNAL